MSSFLPGFEYDIFISYRQKDNKGDKWVTTFVDALKTELESTFKEDVSIYFDENPNDGLLETHNVDKSLEGKLKCLIFIPIISQTYCDPKSFAWQHEFCAFNKLAKNDGIGRDLRLASGNVASRILPVRIHDLDQEDRTTLETEIGGPLRAVEFIYKEPGVNRPLKPSDNRQDNQNKTDYRNQINKVANSVKELVQSTRTTGSKAPAQINSASSAPLGNRRSVFASIGVFALVILASLAIYYYLQTPKPPSENSKPRIAVMPFKFVGEKGGEAFAASMKDVLVRRLQANTLLSVPPSLVQTDRFANTSVSYRTIVDELDAEFLVAASVHRWGDSIRLIVDLIDPRKDEVRWNQDFKTDFSHIFEIQETIAINMSDALGKTLTAPAKEKIKRIPTKSAEAYDLFLQGSALSNKFFSSGGNVTFLHQARSLLKKSIALDPNFAEPNIELAATYFANGLSPKWDTVAFLLDRGLALDSTSSSAWNLKSQFLFFHNKDTATTEQIVEHGLEQDPYSIELLLWAGMLYDYHRKDGRELTALPYYLQAYHLNPKGDTVAFVLGNIGALFNHIGDYRRSEMFLRQARSIHPDDWRLLGQFAILYWRSGEYSKLSALSDELRELEAKRNPNNVTHLAWKATALLYTGKYKEGLEACDEYLKHENTDKIFSIYTLLLARNGFRQKAEQLWRNKIAEVTKEDPGNYHTLTRSYAALGEKEKALDYLEKAEFTNKDGQRNADFYSRDLMMESIWNEPRFVAKIAKEQERLKEIRERLAKMEAEKIIVVPQFMSNH